MYRLPRDLPRQLEVCSSQEKKGKKLEIECKVRFPESSSEVFDEEESNKPDRIKKIVQYFSTKKDWKRKDSHSIDFYRKEKRITKIGNSYFNTTKHAPSMIEVVNLGDYNLKFTVSEEVYKETKEPKTYDFKRVKDRISFLKGNISIDLTSVIDDIGDQKDEIEIEVIEASLFNYYEFVNAIFEVVSTQIDPRIELTSFINKSLGGSPNDRELNGNLVSKPRDLLFKDLTNDGILDHYTVSVKADGEFRLMVFYSSGVWLIHYSRNKEKNYDKIAEISDFQDLENSIFPGEIAKSHKKSDLFLPFDCCIYQGKKLIDKNYLERRRHLKNFHGKRIGKYNVMEKKIFTYKENSDDFYRVMRLAFKEEEEVPYETDGHIFTPIYSDYVAEGQHQRKENRVLSRYQDVCKYKIPEKQTIDFEVIGGRLFSAGHKLFEGSNNNPFCEKNYILENEEAGLNEDNIEGMIVEFGPTYSKNKNIVYKPIRIRNEKPDPNGLQIAQEGWNIQKDPILPSTLKGEDVRLLRKYNNKIKGDMIKKMSGYVVDIGTGKGGDLGKYNDNNQIVSVLGVEPNHDFVMEMKDRNYKIKKFELLECGGEESDKIVSRLRDILRGKSCAPEEMCNMNINFMISLSFFWKDREMLSGIIRTIHKVVEMYHEEGGKAKVLINFFTIVGKRVKNMFKKYGDEIHLNTITLKRIDHDTISVDIQDSETVHKQEEYFVDLEELFNETSFKILSQDTPCAGNPGDYILSRPEKEYNSLFSYGSALYISEEDEDKSIPPSERMSIFKVSDENSRERMDWIHPGVSRVATLDKGNSLGHSLLKLLNHEYRNGNIQKKLELAKRINFNNMSMDEISSKVKHGIVVWDSNGNKEKYGSGNRWIMLYKNQDGSYEPLVHRGDQGINLVFDRDSSLL